MAACLQEFSWKTKYEPIDGNFLSLFYIPALSCAVRYDRTTGFFDPYALACAARGVHKLVKNHGHMRILVGCTLDRAEVEAIQRGESLRNTVDANMQRSPFDTSDSRVYDALELLAWMVAREYLDVRVAVPMDRTTGLPCPDISIFHEKSGIIEDSEGNRLVFHGSLNETYNGWMQNWESFHVYCSWAHDLAHVDDEERSFQRLWANQDPTARVLELGDAVREKLLRFTPKTESLPTLLRDFLEPDPIDPIDLSEKPGIEEPEHLPTDRYTAVWDFIRTAPAKDGGGEYVGEATCVITPWPHQVRAFERMYKQWPPRLLIADEVGLGKTIEAGLLIRQAWLSGKAKRILILTPKAVLPQWQNELREKFNLNVPIFENGQLKFCPSPALFGNLKRPVSDTEWHKEAFLLVSSDLMRRPERAKQLLNDAEPWDLLVLDEAHHARRKASRDPSSNQPNRLLRLMRGLKTKTQGLILLTATPMQIDPIEVWDLLDLLELPPLWDAASFLKFFELSAHPNPDEQQLRFMADLFHSMETRYQPMTEEEAIRLDPKQSKVHARKLLKALRSSGTVAFKGLSSEDRRTALRLMKAYSPTRMLISRHTRELLRKYHDQGKLSTNIAKRTVDDCFVTLTGEERKLYEAVEAYITTTYNNAAASKRTSVGFVMTIYRRRLSSSFDALEMTLRNRLEGMKSHGRANLLFSEEDIPDDESQDEGMESEEAASLEKQALQLEEIDQIHALLQAKKRLSKDDSKTIALLGILKELQQEGYTQVIIFTQFTDTLDSLRLKLCKIMDPSRILCFSGRGGEQWGTSGWQAISRETTKDLFREEKAEILLCTDAAAEGLNLQTCGALINYDMPWNPMKVEQRIGRIDRLGQRFSTIKIINLMYKDTVETDVYVALRERIGLFSTFIGRLQPILAKLPKTMSELVLRKPEDRFENDGAALALDLTSSIEKQQQETGFDLDEVQFDNLDMPQRPAPLYDLAYLESVLSDPALLPPGYEAKLTAGAKDYAYLIPGQETMIRVTTNPTFYEQHAESVELWSPGSPIFPLQTKN